MCEQYDNASAVMVVYSIASRESLQSCHKWVQGELHAIMQSSCILLHMFCINIIIFHCCHSRALVSYFLCIIISISVHLLL